MASTRHANLVAELGPASDDAVGAQEAFLRLLELEPTNASSLTRSRASSELTTSMIGTPRLHRHAVEQNPDLQLRTTCA